MSDEPELPKVSNELAPTRVERVGKKRNAANSGVFLSLRIKENLIQFFIVASSTGLAVIWASVSSGQLLAIVMTALLAAIVSTFISGFVMMVLGWLRVAKKP